MHAHMNYCTFITIITYIIYIYIYIHMIYYDITWHAMTCHDVTWHDMPWHDMTSHITLHCIALHCMYCISVDQHQLQKMTKCDVHLRSFSPAPWFLFVSGSSAIHYSFGKTSTCLRPKLISAIYQISWQSLDIPHSDPFRTKQYSKWSTEATTQSPPLSSSSLEATSSSGRPQSLDPKSPNDLQGFPMWSILALLISNTLQTSSNYDQKSSPNNPLPPTTSMHRWISPPSRTPLDPCEKFDSLSPSASKTPCGVGFSDESGLPKNRGYPSNNVTWLAWLGNPRTKWRFQYL